MTKDDTSEAADARRASRGEPIVAPVDRLFFRLDRFNDSPTNPLAEFSRRRLGIGHDKNLRRKQIFLN